MICGIDLAGTASRPTGVCMLAGNTQFFTVYTDSEILSLLHDTTPLLVAVDAPLSFRGEPFRDGDKELRKHYPILPLTFRGMQSLTQRAIALVSVIPFPVIEVYPHASRKILSISEKEDLLPYGITTLPSTPHQLDAAVCALTGKYYLHGKYKTYGAQDPIIVPEVGEPLPDP